VDTVAHGEMAEAQLDHLIRRRDDKRRLSEGERLEEELYAPSVRAYNEQRRLQSRYEWHLHHVGQAARLRHTLENLIAYHEEQAAKLLEGETA
jgi:hypothetical protein